ncbi:hypothetical protein Tco_0017106 [Tanacetum coccineum]
MVSVTKSADMTLPYGMLLTRLIEHICVSHPHAFSDDLYLVDHVMIPLPERRVFRIMAGGKRPRLLTLTPYKSSESTSSSSHQEEENNPVNNFTLDPIPYINQLSSIEGGESPKFKQTKGMFKCLGHFLSNLGKRNNKAGPFGDKGTGAASSTVSICSFLVLIPPLKNPPRKVPKTDFIDISSNESSSLQNHPINTTLDTTLALLIPPSTLGHTNPTQGNIVSPLAPRAIIFSTPPNSPIEPHPYLASLDDLPPRRSNPQPQSHSQGLFQTPPLPTPMDFKPSLCPINLSNSRISAQPESFLSREQVLHQLNQYQDFDHHIDEAIQNAEQV